MMSKRLAAAVLAVMVLAGCGSTSTTTVTAPARSGKPRGEGADRLPAKRYTPASGLAAIRPSYHAAGGCGIERWAVKTGTDPAAASVSLSPQDTTIVRLSAIAPPVNPTDRVAPVETTVFRLQAAVTAIKQEADSDYHLVLQDTAGNTMIAESPAPSCASGSVFAGQIAQVRAAIDRACPNVGPSYESVSIPADLTGVGFFDRIHGQRGVARNGIEEHPLLAITLQGRC